MKNRVSIITVNYNGEKYLETFLNSTRQLNYPKNLLETLVVDNCSTDNSVKMIEEKYPEVRVIKSLRNSGFGGGNNLGMKVATGEFFFLVNNDTVLEPDSLKNIVKSFLTWSKLHKVGAVTAKMVLFDKYIPLTLQNASLNNFSVYGQSEAVITHVYKLLHETTQSTFYEAYIPIRHDFDDDLELQLEISKFNQRSFEIKTSGRVMKLLFEKGKSTKKVKIRFTKEELAKNKKDLIQNAGNFYFRDGFGRDRGALIYAQKQYYEPDFGQYNKEEFVPGFCGAGVLIPRSTILKVGDFDERFFMYYEDGDLSLRIRKFGMKILYCPAARIRHIHTGSSTEWSAFFVFNVEKNRLLFMAKHWPMSQSIKEWVKYALKDTLLVPIYYWKENRVEEAKTKFLTRLKVNILLILPFISSLFYPNKFSKKEIKELF